MTIGFFIDEYLPRLNGVVTSTIKYREALEKLGHTVYIIAPTEPDYKETDDNVIRVPSFEPKVLEHKTRQALIYPGLAKKLAKKCKFDIVHSQTQFGMGLLAHEVAKTLSIPHVSTMHTVFAELVDLYTRDGYLIIPVVSVLYPLFFRTMPKYDWRVGENLKEHERIKEQAWRVGSVFLNNTSGVIAPSAHIAKTLKKYGLKQTCHLLSNGLDVEHFNKLKILRPPKDLPKKLPKDIWVVCVGRLSPEKRQRALIESMVELKNKHTKLLLVGPGPAEDELSEVIDKLGLQDRVFMLGRRDNDVIPAIMARCDIFALVSYRFDNQPMVILEALAAGLPIVYCDDNLKEGITTRNSVLAATPGPESLAKAIDELAFNGKKRKAMAKESLRLSADFDITLLAKKLESIYVGVLKKEHRPKSIVHSVRAALLPKHSSRR